jgi:Domain of unknown function (DUF5060)/Putative collagen-binding domain of a collagenase
MKLHSIAAALWYFAVVNVMAAKPIAKAYPGHWGEPPQIETRDLRPLPGGFGEGSSTLGQWIQQNIDQDAARKTGILTMHAREFLNYGKGFYLDQEKWIAIDPEMHKSADGHCSFPYPAGKYDVTMFVVGEPDGQSTFQLTINNQQLSSFTAALGEQPFEEGPKFSNTWKGIDIPFSCGVRVSGNVASADGKEWSRARISRIEFVPADETTKAAVTQFIGGRPTTPAKPEGPELVDPREPDGKGEVSITGELKQWHKVNLTLDGPFAHERDTQPNAFKDHAFNVRFTHESGEPSYQVPGYFAADGDASESSSESGIKWRAHLSPDKAGTWTYTVSFKTGEDSAISHTGVSLAPFDGITGKFLIAPADKSGRDFRAHGRLQYVGKHHLQFAGTKDYFIKAGPDSPETMLGYEGFDNTVAYMPKKVPLKSWAPHLSDWRTGDPTWKDGKGKGLIGALNYLAEKGVNSISFLTYAAAGDGDSVWPFISRDARLQYDCSKLDQWGIVFDHATANGLHLHFKLQETENDDDRLGASRRNGYIPQSLDGGKLQIERKLYCREIIARFGHALALNWNIGEENSQTSDEIAGMVKYLHDTDPYKHHIVLHTFPPEHELMYRPLLGEKSLLTGASLQNPWNHVHQRTLQWRQESAAAGKPWVIANDEQNPAHMGVPPDPGYKGFDGIAKGAGKPLGTEAEGYYESKGYTMHDIRKLTLWGNIMAGGAGVEYYFGYNLVENDLVAQDLRSRDKSWDYCRIALDFFRNERMPFEEMNSANALIGNPENHNSKFCFAKQGQVYLIYLPNGGATTIDLTRESEEFKLRWFNPRDGEWHKSTAKLQGGAEATISAPDSDDWLAVIKK